ncbi:MAG: transcription elongation factor GreA [Clostridiaceae bacterium]|jgi:transcription elongation factor GreA|nr:transcription elongation factor GreA [Clostridiales bacterium]MDD2572589.1 transcription elongation factor GreA [Eubacteriales bacterium]NLG29621.1 transcription elongation factor GreA [Clostridiaceae bacterium]MDD3418499.1 transcription elongation factor GreA [Eubacteriales bacterium]MDD3540808.1 transcription elongation factor GreA [Eubacteriales bacterium]
MAVKVYEMTYGKIREYQEELEDRKTRVAAEIAERLKEARAHGDITENSEFDDAKQAYADNDLRIMEIEEILKNAKVIDEKDISRTRVTLGGQVLLRHEESGTEEEYMIVSAKEEDILIGKLSSDSPVGQAIMGKKKGDVVHVKTPTGILTYSVVRISKPKGLDE